MFWRESEEEGASIFRVRKANVGKTEKDGEEKRRENKLV